MARLRLLLIAALVLAPQLAAAQDDDEEADYARPGLYLKSSGGIALTTSPARFPATPALSWDPSFGVDFGLGWRESERLALEIEIEWITNTNGIGFGSWLGGVNGKFFFLEDRIQPYFLVGAGALGIRTPGMPSTRIDWGFRTGLGLDFYLTENWAVTGETTFVGGVGQVLDHYFLTVNAGVMYRF